MIAKMKICLMFIGMLWGVVAFGQEIKTAQVYGQEYEYMYEFTLGEYIPTMKYEAEWQEKLDKMDHAPLVGEKIRIGPEFIIFSNMAWMGGKILRIFKEDQFCTFELEAYNYNRNIKQTLLLRFEKKDGKFVEILFKWRGGNGGMCYSKFKLNEPLFNLQKSFPDIPII